MTKIAVACKNWDYVAEIHTWISTNKDIDAKLKDLARLDQLETDFKNVKEKYRGLKMQLEEQPTHEET